MARISGVGFDFGAKSPDVYVNQSTIAEIVVSPNLVEKGLATEHFAGVVGQLAEQSELGLCEVNFFAPTRDLSLIRNDFKVAECDASMRCRRWPCSA
jgi:hypothetical protein